MKTPKNKIIVHGKELVESLDCLLDNLQDDYQRDIESLEKRIELLQKENERLDFKSKVFDAQNNEFKFQVLQLKTELNNVLDVVEPIVEEYYHE